MKRPKTRHKSAELAVEPANEGLLGTIFFDVPLYRLTREKYESQRASFVQRSLADGGPYSSREQKDLWQDRFEEIYGGSWLFNEIIGFVRLYFCGTQIRGEYWRVKAKRMTKTRKKIFAFRELNVTYEEEIPPKASNNDILRLLLKYLSRARSEPRLKNLYIDTSVLEHIGSHVDWNALLDATLTSTGAKR